MANPASHPDITAIQAASETKLPVTTTQTQTQTKGKAKTTPNPQPIAQFTHKDGFDKLPLFQSNLVKVETNMATRIGGRGLVALEDIQPGTLLLCEYIRHPFQKGLRADDGTPIRPEVEFIQEFCFDMTNQQRVEILHDLAPLFPFKPEEIEHDHREFLIYVYGEFLTDCLAHLLASKNTKITTPTTTMEIDLSLLLRLICVIHFNSFPSGILLHTSMVNHNCQPNAVKLFIPRPEIANNSKECAKSAKSTVHKSLYQPKTLSQRVYSELRSTNLIKKGEEIFISYIPSHLNDLTMTQRQTYLYRQFRFNCDCQLCGYEKSQIEIKSDGNKSSAADPTTTGSEINIFQYGIESSLDFKTNWIDELTRNYVNFTTGEGHETSEKQHNEYLKATRRAKQRNLHIDIDSTDKNENLVDDGVNEEDGEDGEDDNVQLNDQSLMSFREIYGLPVKVNVQVFVLLQSVPILYPFIFPAENTNNIITEQNDENIAKEQLLTKCHKLILMVSKDLLEHIHRDLSLDTISLVLYLYMLLKPMASLASIAPNAIQSHSTVHLLPWSGVIQLSAILTELFVELLPVEDDDKGYEIINKNGENGNQKYILDINNKGSQNDRWTVDKFLAQLSENLSNFISPSDIITSSPLLVNIDDIPERIRNEYHLVPKATAEEDSAPIVGTTGIEETPKINQKLTLLLYLMKPISQLLISKYTERLMASIHLTVTSIGLISSLFSAQHHLKQYVIIASLGKKQDDRKVGEKTEAIEKTETLPEAGNSTPPSEPENAQMVRKNHFNLLISTNYNDILFLISYYLQSFLPHTSFASKILRLDLFKKLIGKSPADANRFAEAVESFHFKICDLYNMCPIETIAKGV
jgi:hypothetical protein